ncbi:MAG: hypothetical protein JSU68_10720 [Phycisphaerales bacterium]|nr:MAG: hypothetical protein JSU68_10720 [Phycisphaerales bacterium]
MTPQNTATHTPKTADNNIGTTYPWDQICEPGTYICHWSGHLLRVPEDGVASGRSPLLNVIGNEPLYVTKISDNPYITITKARMLASNMDMTVNF